MNETLEFPNTSGTSTLAMRLVQWVDRPAPYVLLTQFAGGLSFAHVMHAREARAMGRALIAYADEADAKAQEGTHAATV